MTVCVSGAGLGDDESYYDDVNPAWTAEHALWGLGAETAEQKAERELLEQYAADRAAEAKLIAEKGSLQVPRAQEGPSPYRRQSWWDRHGPKVLIAGGVVLVLGATSLMLAATFGAARHRPAYAGLGRVRRRRRR